MLFTIILAALCFIILAETSLIVYLVSYYKRAKRLIDSCTEYRDSSVNDCEDYLRLTICKTDFYPAQTDYYPLHLFSFDYSVDEDDEYELENITTIEKICTKTGLHVPVMCITGSDTQALLAVFPDGEIELYYHEDIPNLWESRNEIDSNFKELLLETFVI